MVAPSTVSAQTIGLATQYGQKGDKWAGEVFACYFKNGKVLRRHERGAAVKKMDPSVFGIAHRTLPCGTLVRICKSKRCTTAPVVDRGPYWAVPAKCMPGNVPPYSCWQKGRSSGGYSIATAIKKKILPAGKWKFANIADLLPRVSRAIRLGGMAAVTVEPLTMDRHQSINGTHERYRNRQQLQGRRHSDAKVFPPAHQGRDWYQSNREGPGGSPLPGREGHHSVATAALNDRRLQLHERVHDNPC